MPLLLQSMLVKYHRAPTNIHGWNWSHGYLLLSVDGQFPDNSPEGPEIWLQKNSACLFDIQLTLYEEEGHVWMCERLDFKMHLVITIMTFYEPSLIIIRSNCLAYIMWSTFWEMSSLSNVFCRHVCEFSNLLPQEVAYNYFLS